MLSKDSEIVYTGGRLRALDGKAVSTFVTPFRPYAIDGTLVVMDGRGTLAARSLLAEAAFVQDADLYRDVNAKLYPCSNLSHDLDFGLIDPSLN
jgi:hypothetical protein